MCFIHCAALHTRDLRWELEGSLRNLKLPRLPFVHPWSPTLVPIREANGLPIGLACAAFLIAIVLSDVLFAEAFGRIPDPEAQIEAVTGVAGFQPRFADVLFMLDPPEGVSTVLASNYWPACPAVCLDRRLDNVDAHAGTSGLSVAAATTCRTLSCDTPTSPAILRSNQPASQRDLC
jgi:hypothetical protein